MEKAIARLLLGESAAIEAVRSLIHKVARAPLPVLIQGPTGVGKELVARALHAASGRSGPIIATNVCSIAESMFESTLFGHVRGAFTGALSDHPGHFVEADGGTLFLDEVGGLGVSQQMALLRVIENGEFRPIGARSDRRSNFRLISATNESVDRLIEEGRFRRDFARRIRGITIDVPALRDRRDDVPTLARHFLRGTCDDRDMSLQLSHEAVDLLQEYDWPDNVRELKHVIECCVLLHEGGEVVDRDTIAQVLKQGQCGGLAEPVAGDAKHGLMDILEKHAWKVGVVAAVLGVHRSTVFRRMRRLNIEVPIRIRRSVELPESSSCDDHCPGKLESAASDAYNHNLIVRPRIAHRSDMASFVGAAR
jgi:DNA-binding NtrC family response regulator